MMHRQIVLKIYQEKKEIVMGKILFNQKTSTNNKQVYDSIHRAYYKHHPQSTCYYLKKKPL